MTRAERNERIRELRYEDGLPCQKIACLFGLSARGINQIAPGRPGKIDNMRLREAFLRSGKSASAVARDLGWSSGRSVDAGRIRKTLGITPTIGGERRTAQLRRFVDAETAARIAESIGVEPWEVGCNDA